MPSDPTADVKQPEQELCSTCHRPKRKRSGGSLTQWMFDSESCNCEFLAYAAQQPGSDEKREKLCFECGKPIAEGRQGSFTQWIFRAETCSCARPDNLTPQALSGGANIAEVREPVEDVEIEWDEALTAQLGLPDERYRAIELLGGGSAARVYKCWDEALNKFVAIKCLARTNLTAAEIVQFQAEAKTTSRLTHENIVRVLDFGANQTGQPYMVMDCLEGRSLATLLTEHGCLATEFVLYLISQVCDGMQHAHDAGIFHRDLKSSNIMVVENNGRPVAKVIDFGIASLAHEGESLVYQGHTLAGTPSYMCPDQIRAEKFDARSDVYSLGCILFELLSGEVPFRGQTALETIAQHANIEAPSLAETNPEGHYSDTIEGITHKSLAKHRDDRYQSMSEFKTDLGEAFAEERARYEESTAIAGSSATDDHMVANMVPGISASTVAPPKSSNRATDRRFLAIAVIALLLLGSGVYYYVSTNKPEPVVKAKKKKKKTTSEDDDDDPYKIRAGVDKVNLHKSFFVDLSSTKKEDADLKQYRGRNDVTELDLVASDITDKGIDDIVGLPLRVLRMEATKVTDVSLKKISGISTLQVFTCGNNGSITADGIKVLEKLPRLRIVSFTETNLTDADMAKLACLKSLEELSMGSMRFMNGDGLIHLKTLPSLRFLKLANNNLSDKALKNISELRTLRELDLRKCRINDRRMEFVAMFDQLEKLSLMQNEMTDEGIFKLRKMKNLRELNLEKCPGVASDGITKLSAQMPQCNILDGKNVLF